jgi:hypothetical protein
MKKEEKKNSKEWIVGEGDFKHLDGFPCIHGD